MVETDDRAQAKHVGTVMPRRSEGLGSGKPRRLVTAFGETLGVAQWAKRFGVDRRAIAKRIDYGWSPEQAITTPVRDDSPGSLALRALERNSPRPAKGRSSAARRQGHPEGQSEAEQAPSALTGRARC